MNNNSNQFTSQAFMDEYLDNLIKKADLQDMDPDYLVKYKNDLLEQVQYRMGLAAMESLDETGMEAYVALMEKAEDKPLDPEEVAEFFRQHVPNYEKLMRQELDVYAQEFASNASALEKKQAE